MDTHLFSVLFTTSFYSQRISFPPAIMLPREFSNTCFMQRDRWENHFSLSSMTQLLALGLTSWCTSHVHSFHLRGTHKCISLKLLTSSNLTELVLLHTHPPTHLWRIWSLMRWYSHLILRVLLASRSLLSLAIIAVLFTVRHNKSISREYNEQYRRAVSACAFTWAAQPWLVSCCASVSVIFM